MIQLVQPMPDIAPKPVFLPYTFATARPNGASGRVGMDIKYPFSTTLTGLMAINPDFQTIVVQPEQDFSVWGVVTWTIHKQRP